MSRGRVLSLLFGLAVLVLVIFPMVGMEFVPLSVLWKDAGGMDAGILRDLRIPRVLTAFVVGGRWR